jgi:DNA polymerase III alpha subunit (gram-positive type)
MIMHYITIDVETTGLDIYKDEPIQLAYLVYDSALNFKEGSSFYINCREKIPEIITRITGITSDLLQTHGISPEDAVRQWQKVLKMYPPVTLIGYNLINFDFPMIQNWINKYSTIKFKYPPICEIYDVMITIAEQRKSKWLKLIEAATLYCVNFEAEALHDAMTDIKVTWELYKKIKLKI